MMPVAEPPAQKPAYSPMPRSLQPPGHQRQIGPGVGPVQLAQSLMPSMVHPFERSEFSAPSI